MTKISQSNALLETDAAVAQVMMAVAKQYGDQINDPDSSQNEVRMEILRKLELISHSIKTLMKLRQRRLSMEEKSQQQNASAAQSHKKAVKAEEIKKPR
jgi:hypothetical protein